MLRRLQPFPIQPCWVIGLTLLGLGLAMSPAADLPPDQVEFFENRIRPILAQECYECHNSKDKAKGGLVLDHRAAWERGGDSGPDASTKDRAENLLNTRSVGSGPFSIASYVPQQELVLVRNPNYWRGPAKIERVVIRNVLEPAVQALQLIKAALMRQYGLFQTSCSMFCE